MCLGDIDKHNGIAEDNIYNCRAQKFQNDLSGNFVVFTAIISCYKLRTSGALTVPKRIFLWTQLQINDTDTHTGFSKCIVYFEFIRKLANTNVQPIWVKSIEETNVTNTLIHALSVTWLDREIII